MSSRILALLVLVIFPGAAFTGISAFYLFPEWVVLGNSYQNYQRLAQTPIASVRDLDVAHAAEPGIASIALPKGLVFYWVESS